MIGSLLFGAELFAIDTAFYLIFIGAAAFTVGLVGMIGFELPTWLGAMVVLCHPIGHVHVHISEETL